MIETAHPSSFVKSILVPRTVGAKTAMSQAVWGNISMYGGRQITERRASYMRKLCAVTPDRRLLVAFVAIVGITRLRVGRLIVVTVPHVHQRQNRGPRRAMLVSFSCRPFRVS